MTILDKLAARNTKRLEVTASMSDAATNTYIGTATSDSTDGIVAVVMSNDAAHPEWYDGNAQEVVLPTTTSVNSGDTVMVSTFGGSVLSTPVVTGVVGKGDAMQEAINATNQYFWQRSDNPDGAGAGAFVTEVPQDEFTDSTSPNFLSGPNSLWNSLGMLFRDGLTNLMAVLTSGVAIYDGLGNAASNIVASFTETGATIGRLAEGHAVFDSSGMHVYDGANSVFDATYSATDDGTETVEDATIGTSSGGYLLFSETTLAGASAPYKVTTYLSSLLSLARLWLEYTPSTAQIGLRARHQNGGSVGGTAAVTLTSDSSTFEGNVAIRGTSVTANGLEIGKSTSTTVSRGSAASTIDTNSVCKFGNVVTVSLGGIKLASALSSGSTTGTVATVPTGYRPATNVYAAIGSTGAHGGSYARITDAGVVTVRNSSGTSIATSASLCFTVTYTTS